VRRVPFQPKLHPHHVLGHQVDPDLGDSEDPYRDLIRANYYQIKNTRIKEINGLIGLSEWPKKMFGE
jgi:hypothetical protein